MTLAVSALRNSDSVVPETEYSGASPIVSIDNVSFCISNADKLERAVLRNFSLDIAAGEFIAIVGPSGCGKSTLLNLISGLLTVTSGAVNFHSSDLRLGYMFQSDGLLPWRTIVDNVALGLELKEVGKAERHAKARDILDKLGLAAFATHLPFELSGGMRQRVALARMWVLDPTLILMDEPFGALDAQTRLLVQDLFMSYWEEHKKTVILVTHDIEEAIMLADRVVVSSSQPASVKSIYKVEFGRPRRRRELRACREFNDLWEIIWNELRSDATRALETI